MKKQSDGLDGSQEKVQQVESEEQKQQRSDFMFALAGVRLECCKMCRDKIGEINLTRAEKLFQYVISGTK